ncbi:aldehyde dehydrogenase family protein [Microvirga sp. VF16]|uniref:aldehyde dehydrogenase family protein n=1 Tax=Microvirga sp. VF16 TaxID=2807101 RepID=UPI00193E969D|nr:aldehyde dehydrogenase family protein [Microvirga sp. VF16]QRM32199.1 aldehyde dehydrogenase family protein [Microvirga sp. VF16]
MHYLHQLYIGGRWVSPAKLRLFDLINPATETVFATFAPGDGGDVGRAVRSARQAFKAYAQTTRQERLDLLRAIVDGYQRRMDDLVEAVMLEMGAPLTLARERQAPAGLLHLQQSIKALETYSFDTLHGSTLITREPIGVCGLITPWNWPLLQIACKVGPALAAGCTMILKPSEGAPASASIFAEILHEAGVPSGVFNLVQGDGATVGQALASHPGVDMVSFTGSTQAGILVAQAAAGTVKRVHQELGGKSPNILLDDTSFAAAVSHGAYACFANSGQSCNAPTRLLVPAGRQQEAARIAKRIAEDLVVDQPRSPTTALGPVANKAQFTRVQNLIVSGLREGATLIAGGPGRPAHLDRGYYVRPTVFADVHNRMAIAQEEIFGPVLSILPYESESEVIEMANDTSFGLSSYVTSADPERARRIARQMRAGMVHLNGASSDPAAPFGGYKQSGNGRERGVFGLEEFLETKSIFGYSQT